MGKLQSKLVPLVLTVGLGVVTAFAFQNCAGSKFTTSSPDIVDAHCAVDTGCASAASTGSNSSTPTSPSSTNTTLPSSPSVDPSTLYNFVAADQSTCENSIRTRLGLSVACSIGGGCGVSCGFPSATCPSANPTYWGACITAKGLGADGKPAPPATTVDPTLLYNFVAATKADCDAAIVSRGKVGSCTVGGGCGVSCGMPSPTCPSANPSLWGACLK